VLHTEVRNVNPVAKSLGVLAGSGDQLVFRGTAIDLLKWLYSLFSWAKMH